MLRVFVLFYKRGQTQKNLGQVNGFDKGSSRKRGELAEQIAKNGHSVGDGVLHVNYFAPSNPISQILHSNINNKK
jgi:hypothetical protein